jgi:hypothetical protein
MCVIIPSWCLIHRISLGLVYINTRPCHIIWFYRCSYTGISNQHNVSPSLFTYLDNSMCVIIPSWCRIHRISLGSVYITTRPCHIIWFYHCSYTCIRIQLNVSPSLFRYLDKSICFMIPSWCRIHCTSLGLIYINAGSCHVIWFYCCSYTGITIQLTVSPSVIDIPRQFHVRHVPLLALYTPHVSRFSLHKLQTLSYHMILPLFIYRFKYSIYRFSVAICPI